MRKWISTTVCLFMLMRASAQDPHFSQFFSSPLTLNPAFTGKFDGTYRVAGNYRNQWPTINNAFTTATGAVDFHILQDRIASNDTWGVGLMAYNDNSANGAVNFNYGTISTAYHKGLDEEGYNQIGLGFQLTYANMIINTADLKFEDQLTTNGFTGVTSEIFSGSTLKSNYVDVNAGILYNGSTTDRNNFYFGVSLYHITRPKQQFTGGLFALNPRATIHAGTYFPIGETTTLHLSAMQSFQGGASETVLGGAFQLSPTTDAEKPVSLYAGGWLRLNDAIIPYVGLEFGDLRLGVSYDVNTSSLKTASQGTGGIEVSLIYVRRPSTDKPINCPKF
ncbi:MAG: PorP/SprF family type IX secretion system membrane protein [Bacteroidota bacterium]|nr:PorP/SprF family type IX secretion system membrane protein [Bacteroidota bacterium]